VILKTLLYINEVWRSAPTGHRHTDRQRRGRPPGHHQSARANQAVIWPPTLAFSGSRRSDVGWSDGLFVTGFAPNRCAANGNISWPSS